MMKAHVLALPLLLGAAALAYAAEPAPASTAPTTQIEQNFARMQSMMKQMYDANGPRRLQLMQQHLALMQRQMGLMDRMMDGGTAGSGMMGGSGRMGGMMGGSADGCPDRGDLQQRMQMMDRMMQQMQAQQQAMQQMSTAPTATSRR